MTRNLSVPFMLRIHRGVFSSMRVYKKQDHESAKLG